MKLDKACEILDNILSRLSIQEEPDDRKAIELGREALKAVKKMRVYPFPDEILHLPGETED